MARDVRGLGLEFIALVGGIAMVVAIGLAGAWLISPAPESWQDWVMLAIVVMFNAAIVGVVLSGFRRQRREDAAADVVSTWKRLPTAKQFKRAHGTAPQDDGLPVRCPTCASDLARHSLSPGDPRWQMGGARCGIYLWRNNP
ncbi:hypothetical protein LJR168_003776 [Pseudoxanthomonas sp. LjRoot168]|uniref:hypothetical protein n=1 Tax=unclassified Pseudoxanthomonas TaxID=2645906 RepID=UPI003ECE2100